MEADVDDFEKPAETYPEQLAYLEQSELCCSDVEALLDYFLDGELLPQLEPRFNEHLSTCELCEELAHDCRHLISLAKSLNEAPIPDDVQARLRETLKREVGFDSSQAPPSRGKLAVVKQGS